MISGKPKLQSAGLVPSCLAKAKSIHLQVSVEAVEQ